MDEGVSVGISVKATTPKSFPYRYAGTPGSSKKRQPGFADPLCSPIAHHGDHIPPSPRGQPTPSPSSKRFMGISSNARNDIYLKTLHNSPYHKTYAPLSATPGYSPAYQTPIRTQAQSPRPGVTSTPQSLNRAENARKYVTPKNVITNPFDVGLDDLHLPAYMSPGLFAVSSTPASEERQRAFRWDIEHIAELNPVDIPLDDIPKQHTHMIPDPETEERAQRAIERFFASNMIAPSPWSDPKERKGKKNVIATPSTQAGKEELMTELQGSIQKCLPPKQGMEDASSQTVLTLPVNFDLQKVLSAYMTYDSHEDGNQQDMLSTSSLRRKLFFHGDTSSLAPSPVKGSGDEGTQSEPMSPKLNPNWNAATPLRNTPAFSSSPIKKGTTPQHRRCSSDPELIASPELSPIVDRTKPHSTKKSRSRSSGMFEPSPTSFCISPVHDVDHDAQHGMMSPILFEGISPVGAVGGDMQPKFTESPGFSPIRPPKTPIRKIMRRSQEESYIQDDAIPSDEESGPITPVTLNSGVSNNSHTPVDNLSPIHKTPKQRTSTFILKSYSCTDLEHTAMDFETAAKPKTVRLPGDIMTSSMCETRDFSFSDMEYPDETQHRTSLSNQDTGYQTASLQSTNPESASLHTNLTNQFGNLPFNSTSQELVFQTSQSAGNQERPAPPILNLTQQMKAMKSQEMQRESPNTSVSKQLFPDEDKIAKNLFSSLEDSDNEDTPNPRMHSENRMKFDYNDSALPDESGNFSKELPFSRFKTGRSDSDFQEEEVISRAKQALAMASSYFPKERSGKIVPDVADSMDFAVSSPRKQFGSAIRTEQSASEVAYHVLRRAGEDLAKFDQFFSTQKKENT